MRFKDLSIGGTFDFVSPDTTYNSFFKVCKKVSSRKYIDTDDMEYTIGSYNAEVYHVNVYDWPIDMDI